MVVFPALYLVPQSQPEWQDSSTSIYTWSLQNGKMFIHVLSIGSEKTAHQDCVR